VTVEGTHIAAVEAPSGQTPDVDLGDAAVLPGLVNAHTHLDLSGCRGHITPAGAFSSWLRRVIQYRRGLSPEMVAANVQAGVAESVAFGTTLVGDSSGQGLSWPVLRAAPLWAVVFYELLGLPRSRARQAWRDAHTWWESHPATPTCRPGLSPHAPYSVRAPLFRAIGTFARRRQASVAVHLAETAEECQLLARHSGPFVDFLTELGVWDPVGLVCDTSEVVRHLADALLVHANYLDPSAPIPSGATVVYCPRTHAAFGHPPHPFRQYLATGVRVALGTDSLASSPDLDLLAEVRFLNSRFPEVPGAVLLRMATLAGAEALGWHRQTGSLRPGKSADLVVVPVRPEPVADPHELIWQAPAPVRAVLWRGQWVRSGA
jgi:cytosine/adenosine deaminase-related metal-dependent hydrolase